jgi:hypothetical protein
MPQKSFVVAALLVTVLFLFSSMVVFAKDPHWNGVGWYLVVDVVDLEGLIVLGGPLPDEASCKAKLPPSDDETTYSCEYLNERPDWDL